MAAKSKKRKAFNFFDSLEEACKDYGAKLLVNEFWIDIEFKDGKRLTYALPFDSKSRLNESAFNDMVEAIESGYRGRVFSKDGRFIGYAPEAVSVSEILIASDMMV
jgi:hypothetical protein